MSRFKRVRISEALKMHLLKEHGTKVQGRHYVMSPWWPMPKKTKAITLGSIVLHREVPTEGTIVHEETHIVHNHKYPDGMLAWYASWIVRTLRKGYAKNEYEVEAKQAEIDHDEHS